MNESIECHFLGYILLNFLELWKLNGKFISASRDLENLYLNETNVQIKIEFHVKLIKF